MALKKEPVSTRRSVLTGWSAHTDSGFSTSVRARVTNLCATSFIRKCCAQYLHTQYTAKRLRLYLQTVYLSLLYGKTVRPNRVALVGSRLY